MEFNHSVIILYLKKEENAAKPRIPFPPNPKNQAFCTYFRIIMFYFRDYRHDRVSAGMRQVKISGMRGGSGSSAGLFVTGTVNF